eukprot:TRINITY_DN9543_c1_g1_i1.p1 TRINITY_DN9543_c1_g1~~TRINITY_DN9543_c1_g1_i1.p1  ORF type:complete len:660 (-),score=90.47 TRINITY_DN9543_c1_g1_i1:116-1987(-)
MPGFPPGWKGIERAYGANSKSAGKTYVRWATVDGKYKNIQNAAEVFELHCKEHGGDPAEMHQNYKRMMEAKRQQQKEDTKAEREARGQLEGKKREEAIERFRSTFGELSGPIVYKFPGWKTRWDYQSGCSQVRVMYTDPEDNNWCLLKDLEAAFQCRIERGDGGHIPDMIREAKENMDVAEFSLGAKRARETGQSYVVVAGKGQDAAREQTTRGKRDRVTNDSYEESSVIKLVKATLGQNDIASALEAAGICNAKGLAQDVTHVSDLLRSRCNFADATGLLAVGTTKNEPHAVIDMFKGIYYQRPESAEGKPYFQRMVPRAAGSRDFRTSGVYLHWCPQRNAWRFGRLLDSSAALAFCAEDQASPDELIASSWSLLKELALAGAIASTQAPGATSSTGGKGAATANGTAAAETKADTGETPEREASKRKKEDDIASAEPKKRSRKEKGTEDDTESLELHTGKVCTVLDMGPERSGKDLAEAPKHWPADVRPDPGVWATWLPQDWGQGLKVKMTDGSESTVYVSPKGAVKTGKSLVEKQIGRSLDEWPVWLPKSWAMTKKMQGGTMAPLYIAPRGQICYGSKKEVENHIIKEATGEKMRKNNKSVRLRFPPEVQARLDEVAALS